jgi:hypothetical protein
MRLPTWWTFGSILLVVLIVVSGIAVQTIRHRVRAQGYEERFLVPDVDAYPWERKGEHPEAITWSPEGIIFDPPTGSTAYVAIPARGAYGRPGYLPGLAFGPLGRLITPTRYEFTSVEVEVVVRLQNAYFMILEWGATTVQATPDGVLVTMIEPGLVHTNVPVGANTSVRQALLLARTSKGTCVRVASQSVCRETIAHKNDEYVWIGESRKDREHGGSLLLNTLRIR